LCPPPLSFGREKKPPPQPLSEERGE